LCRAGRGRALFVGRGGRRAVTGALAWEHGEELNLVAIKITVRGLDTATAQVKAAVSEGIRNALNVAGARGEALVKEAIYTPYLGRPPAVATGNLVNSITASPVSQSPGISRVEIIAAAPADQYAGYVEAGTGPHFPPPSALLLWVKKKFSVSTEKQALSIAFAVARKIAKRGVTAFGMFARAFNKLEGELGGIFEAQIAKALRALGAAK